MRDTLIGTGFAVLRATGIDRALEPLTGGLGAILMFHHVRPYAPAMAGYAPNRLLEITPAFLDAALKQIRALGLDIVTMDEAVRRLAGGQGAARRFVALTFDDGYRDFRDYALPVLRRHGAPATLFVTTGFADQEARLWWLELEAAVLRLERVRADVAGTALDLPATSPQEKGAAFQTLYRALRAGPEDALRATIAALARQAGVATDFARALCLDWRELADVARDPLVTIGAHTLTHPMLAKHDTDFARREIAGSRRIIGERLDTEPLHFAYPVGDPTSAGEREFTLASEVGYASAVTTRPGMLFGEHAQRMTALPRLSVNGNWQDVGYLRSLLTGVPFLLWNKGRRVA